MSYIEEKLYSQAFEDGVNYAIEKMFGGGKMMILPHLH